MPAWRQKSTVGKIINIQDASNPDAPEPEPVYQASKETSPETTQSSSPSQRPSAPYTTEVNHVIEGPDKPIKPVKTRLRKILLALILLILLTGVGVGGAYLYNYVYDPLKIIAKSFEKLEYTNSFTINADFAESEDFGKPSLMLDYHKLPPKLSRAQFKMLNIGNDPAHSLLFLLIFSSNESFIQTSYSKIDEIENQIRIIFPEILSLHTYQLAQPLLKGEKWLRIETPETEGVRQEGEIQISKEQEENLNEKFIDSIVVRSYKRSFVKDGIKYHKIILGFDKEGLVEFIDAFKDLDLEIELKDINAAIKIINSVESWEEDLVEILIDKETGNLCSLSLSAPKIPEDALETTIEESVGEKENVSYLYNLFSEKISDFVKPSTSTKLVYLGKAIFSNYNSAPIAERPTQIIKFEELTLAFKQDLPILLQMTLYSLQPPSQQPLDLPSPELFRDLPSDVLPESITAPLTPTP